MKRPYRVELHNLDGQGAKRTRVYEMPGPLLDWDYWSAVTDVPCPVCEQGMIRWNEAGYVPGYRICSHCKRHFLAKGNTVTPTLLRVGNRRN